MPRATFRTIASSIKRTATWVACLALLMLPGVAFVQEPELRSLQAYRPQNHYIRHDGFLGRIGQTKTDLDARDAKFRVVPGLADKNCVSFEPTNVRDHYLKQAFCRIVLAKRLDEQKFREDATFCIVGDCTARRPVPGSIRCRSARSIFRTVTSGIATSSYGSTLREHAAVP